MNFIETTEELAEIYGEPKKTSLVKVSNKLTPGFRTWISSSKFCIISTVGPEGTDCSPRGEDGSVITDLDEHTLALPDWQGNNRIDSLRNIVRDERVSLMFMVNGANNVVRVNGSAKITDDPELIDRFARGKLKPRTVIIIKIDEIYTQCAKAMMRSQLWAQSIAKGDVPTVGQLMQEITDGEFEAQEYDKDVSERIAKSMW